MTAASAVAFQSNMPSRKKPLRDIEAKLFFFRVTDNVGKRQLLSVMEKLMDFSEATQRDLAINLAGLRMVRCKLTLWDRFFYPRASAMLIELKRRTGS